jgi:anti-sigma factor RsiW
MSDCDEQLLSAYHDGELTLADRVRVEQHLAECGTCSAALSRLREASQLLSSYPFKDITPEELSNLHLAIDEEASDDQQVVWRIGGTMGLIAASILVVGFAWLRSLPTPTGNPTGETPLAVSPSAAPAWERVAVTGRPDPASYSQNDVQMAEADFMAEQLSAGRAGRSER